MYLFHVRYDLSEFEDAFTFTLSDMSKGSTDEYEYTFEIENEDDIEIPSKESLDLINAVPLSFQPGSLAGTSVGIPLGIPIGIPVMIADIGIEWGRYRYWLILETFPWSLSMHPRCVEHALLEKQNHGRNCSSQYRGRH